MSKSIFRPFVALFLAVALGGCGLLNTAQEPVGAATVADARNIVYTLKSSYAASVVIATQYIRLPACEKPAAPPVCSSEAVVRKMVKARDAARTAIDSAEEVTLNATATTPVLSAAVSAAQSAYSAFKIITDTKS